MTGARILFADVKLEGNREVSVNGQRLEEADMILDEKIAEKQLTVDQQWKLICLLKKNLNKLYFVYRKTQIREGEVTEAELHMRERRAAIRSRRHRPRHL